MMVAVGTDLEGRAREIKGSLDLVIPPLFERGVFFVRGLLLLYRRQTINHSKMVSMFYCLTEV